MSYQITWKDFNGRERITPIFVIGKEKEAIEGLALHTKYKKQVKEIIHIEPLNLKGTKCQILK